MPIMSTKPEPDVALDVVEEECWFPRWRSLPDHLLLQVFNFLDAPSLAKAGLVCKGWLRVAFDELLWKDLFYRHWGISRDIPMAPGKYSWIQEYKRLLYHTPAVESEVLKQHADQVLHVSYSNNGKMFATCSKDGFIRVWDANYPTSIKFKADMRKFTWKYTQFSQFNSTDTLLLVSGVHFGSLSTSGEIAVFSLDGEFVMQSRVMNKPYDVFGTWYNDFYLLSGNLHWTGHLNSCSAIWLNKAYQETGSEEESVVMRLFKFSNINASSIRTIMIANCLNEEDKVTSLGDKSEDSNSLVSLPVIGEQLTNEEEDDMLDLPEMELSGLNEAKLGKEGTVKAPKSLQGIQMFENGEFITKYLEVDADVPNSKLNGTIEYSHDYRMAEDPKQLRAATGVCGYTSGSEHSNNGNQSGSEISERSMNGSSSVDTFDQSQLLSEIETACKGSFTSTDVDDMQVEYSASGNSTKNSNPCMTTEQVRIYLQESPSPVKQPEMGHSSRDISISEAFGVSRDSQNKDRFPNTSEHTSSTEVMVEVHTNQECGDQLSGNESDVSSPGQCRSGSATPKRVLHGQQPEQGEIIRNPSTCDLSEEHRCDVRGSMEELPPPPSKIHFCCVDYKKQKKVSPVRCESAAKSISKPNICSIEADNTSAEYCENHSASDTKLDCVPGRSQTRLCSRSCEHTGTSRPKVEYLPKRQTVMLCSDTNYKEADNPTSCVPLANQSSRLCLGSATLSVENMDTAQYNMEVNPRCLPVHNQCNTQHSGNLASAMSCRPTPESSVVLPVQPSHYKVKRIKKGKGKKIKDKYLIFTKGSETYTPHQIGIKRIKPMRAFSRDGSRLLPNVTETTYSPETGDKYDEVDHLIDMHGHIIGMTLSPDHRYLYVNSRPWPKNYFIENPMYPPPIAQEIDIHVIDLLNMREVGTMHRAHKAYTSNDECFFIFLDVCEEYVASGAEDKHGYLWDRHYGLCLHKYPHTDVVNSVAFNPADPEVLVTVSDDFSIKIWRSLSREKEVIKAFNKEHSIRLKQVQDMVSDTREFSNSSANSFTDRTGPG